MTKEIYREAVYCPSCKKRIFDKLTPIHGLIELKCRHCDNVVEVKLPSKPLSNTINHNKSKTA